MFRSQELIFWGRKTPRLAQRHLRRVWRGVCGRCMGKNGEVFWWPQGLRWKKLWRLPKYLMVFVLFKVISEGLRVTPKHFENHRLQKDDDWKWLKYDQRWLRSTWPESFRGSQAIAIFTLGISTGTLAEILCHLRADLVDYIWLYIIYYIPFCIYTVGKCVVYTCWTCSRSQKIGVPIYVLLYSYLQGVYTCWRNINI